MTKVRPDEVAKARMVIFNWETEQMAAREEEKAEREAAWLQEHVGRRHLVDFVGREYEWDDDRVVIKFEARLLSATKSDGVMLWDNGVTTSNLSLDKPLPEQETVDR